VSFRKKRRTGTLNIRNINKKNLAELKIINAGDHITYTGRLITLRDSSIIKLQENLSIPLKNRIVMYAAGVSGKEIIIGPTTSTRMDSSLKFILEQGVLATIGKGERTEEAVQCSKRYNTPYFLAMSGVSAYLSRFFLKGKIIAFPELGPEAIYEYEVEKLPLITGIDTKGNIFRPYNP
jgi:fumarate hydratase subunit beta